MFCLQNLDLKASGSQNGGHVLTSEELKEAENFQNMMRALIRAEEKSRLAQAAEAEGSDIDSVASEELFKKLKVSVFSFSVLDVIRCGNLKFCWLLKLLLLPQLFTADKSALILLIFDVLCSRHISNVILQNV